MSISKYLSLLSSHPREGMCRVSNVLRWYHCPPRHWHHNLLQTYTSVCDASNTTPRSGAPHLQPQPRLSIRHVWTEGPPSAPLRTTTFNCYSTDHHCLTPNLFWQEAPFLLGEIPIWKFDYKVGASCNTRAAHTCNARAAHSCNTRATHVQHSWCEEWLENKLPNTLIRERWT